MSQLRATLFIAFIGACFIFAAYMTLAYFDIKKKKEGLR